jgi:tRNA pseudouridine(55) synthase
MIFYEKKIGETPLEMLDRLRLEKTELKDSKLSYAGRLDPMAHGEMLVLVDEENKDYKKYLGFDKKYQATFLIGVSTDTGDILGLIKEFSEYDNNVKKEEITRQILDFKKITKQKYPWFSSMVVDGLKLFDHFKKGNLNTERPTRKVQIKEIENIEFKEIPKQELKDYIFENVSKVKGDFRQKETLQGWDNFFKNFNTEVQGSDKINFLTVTMDITVTSGTYIRGLTENFNNPVTLMGLKRIKIIV